MSKFIVVHTFPSQTVKWISISSIDGFYSRLSMTKGYATSKVTLLNGQEMFESPEELIALIEAAEEDERKKKDASAWENVMNYTAKLPELFPSMFPQPTSVVGAWPIDGRTSEATGEALAKAIHLNTGAEDKSEDNPEDLKI